LLSNANDSRRPWPDVSPGSKAASYPTRPMTTGWPLAPETPGSSSEKNHANSTSSSIGRRHTLCQLRRVGRIWRQQFTCAADQSFARRQLERHHDYDLRQQGRSIVLAEPGDVHHRSNGRVEEQRQHHASNRHPRTRHRYREYRARRVVRACLAGQRVEGVSLLAAPVDGGRAQRRREPVAVAKRRILSLYGC
jgi:hypothetical protein